MRYKVLTFFSILVTVFGVFTTSALAYDGESYASCQNRYTVGSVNIYSGNTYKGNMSVFGCTNGFFLRVNSSVKSGLSGSLTRYTSTGAYNGSQICGYTYAYSTATNLLSRKNGHKYTAYANIDGSSRYFSFSW